MKEFSFAIGSWNGIGKNGKAYKSHKKENDKTTIAATIDLI